MATPVFQGYQRVQLSDTEKAFYEDIAGRNCTVTTSPIISPSADAMGRVLNSFAAIAQRGRAQAQAMATPYLQRLTPKYFSLPQTKRSWAYAISTLSPVWAFLRKAFTSWVPGKLTWLVHGGLRYKKPLALIGLGIGGLVLLISLVAAMLNGLMTASRMPATESSQMREPEKPQELPAEPKLDIPPVPSYPDSADIKYASPLANVLTANEALPNAKSLNVIKPKVVEKTVVKKSTSKLPKNKIRPPKIERKKAIFEKQKSAPKSAKKPKQIVLPANHYRLGSELKATTTKGKVMNFKKGVVLVMLSSSSNSVSFTNANGDMSVARVSRSVWTKAISHQGAKK